MRGCIHTSSVFTFCTLSASRCQGEFSKLSGCPLPRHGRACPGHPRSCETPRPQPIVITGLGPVMTRRVSFPAGAQRREGIHLHARADTAHHHGLGSAVKRRMPLCHFSAKRRLGTSPVESLPISTTFAESSPIGSYDGHCYAIPRSESEHMSNEVKTWNRFRKAHASTPYEYAAIRLKGNT
jgi:hypothetical protein